MKSPKEKRVPTSEQASLPEVPVVGIGASAGGLAAFEAFFSGIPRRSLPGMAFVLVQHLSPDHDSLLAELIGRCTDLEVLEVQDGMRIRPDRAYIIPPGQDLLYQDGCLRLRDPLEARGHRHPVDVFFQSLAAELKDRAICVVLSGTGSDGTQGLRAVKAAGGLAMAQDPESAEFDGMPRSAIATGLVDFVLQPTDMAGELLRHLGAEPRAARPSVEEADSPSDEVMRELFVILHSRTGQDFSEYKRISILRRIERRMAVHQVETPGDYVRYLQQTPEEVDVLFGELLIGVTHFFRDAEAFEALVREGVPRLLEGKASGSTIRVWVPGCSTGEEAYSIAMVLREQLEASRLFLKLQIFATDIDPVAIQTARAGVYPASIAGKVSQERLERFFVLENGGASYRIQRSIRDIVVFSEQDVTADPPFSRIDLISCRNLLIYLGANLQKRLIPLFHYALNPGGLLFLGTSESVGESAERFTPLDRAAKLFLRKEEWTSTPLPGRKTDAGTRTVTPRGDARSPHREPAPPEPSRRQITEEVILAHHTPAAALVEDSGEILYLHGQTGLFLEPAPGEAALNIMKMAREGLRRDLTIALHRAVTLGANVHCPGIRIPSPGGGVTVDLDVRRVLLKRASGGNLYLVVLQRVAASGRPAEPAEQDPSGERPASDPRISHLEEELRAKEDYLQAVLQEMQVSNEELRSSVEELQSMNEELQSTNEELQTSKEELQSVNEELATINTELETKVAALSRVEADMDNLLAGTGVGTIFVDMKLRIQRFTPAATELLNLIPGDVGRPVGHLTSRLEGYDRLSEETHGVLDTLVPREVEVRTLRGVWYLLRIRPYRTLDNVIEGAVITFTDITEVKLAQETLRESEGLRRRALVLEQSMDPIIVQDGSGRILTWNPAAARVYGWSEAEALEMPYTTLVPEELKVEARSMLGLVTRGGSVPPQSTRRCTRDGRTLPAWVTATPLLSESGEIHVSTTERVAESLDAPGADEGGAPS